MPLDPEPLSTMIALVRDRASGEFVCASEELEVHVYFQRGRLAWATDASRPLAFTRHLLEHTRIDADTYRELLETCRREKRPLGETLVSWGVASLDEVRDALHRQIDMAVGSIRSAGPAQTLFLRRPSQFEGYDTRLTFELDDILVGLAEKEAGVEGCEDGADREPRPERVTGVRLVPPAAVRRTELEEIRASLDGLEWIERLDGTALVESSPPSPGAASRIPAAVAARTLLDGAQLVALRLAGATLAGVQLPSGQSLWCQVAAETTVGAVVTSLTALLPSSTEPTTFAPAPAGELWTSERVDASLAAPTREFLERCPEIHGVVVTDESKPVLGIGRASISAESLHARVGVRGSALTLASGVRSADPDASATELSPRRLMSAEADYVLFATELDRHGSGRFVWIALDRACSKGLGWGYLTSLGRQLSNLWRTAAA
ncbi:MAG: hypothetical protein KIS78_13900 [Labilithrix sp.]|nr:hypothetical protein [Labilithrix sp.]MCW5833492.1 hypothetical protein [Labilithrix sp.]